MGELSKLTGELGENIVQSFMQRVGWASPITPLDIECQYQELHRSRGAERNRSTHGLDFVVCQRDYLLNPDTQDTIAVSAKYREYKSIQSSTKEYVDELLQAIQCLSESDSVGGHRVAASIRDVEYCGVLFTLDPDEDVDRDVVAELKDFRGMTSSAYPVFIVDNRRLSFILRVLDFAHRKYGKENVQFFYYDTGFNYTDQEHSGPQLPVQCINSSVLPLKVVKDEAEILVLAMMENFNDSTLKSDIGRAQTLTRGWGNRIVLAYPDFRVRSHGTTVQKVLQEVKDSDFAKKVDVENYIYDFHSLEAND